MKDLHIIVKCRLHLPRQFLWFRETTDPICIVAMLRRWLNPVEHNHKSRPGSHLCATQAMTKFHRVRRTQFSNYKVKCYMPVTTRNSNICNKKHGLQLKPEVCKTMDCPCDNEIPHPRLFTVPVMHKSWVVLPFLYLRYIYDLHIVYANNSSRLLTCTVLGYTRQPTI